MTDTDRSEVQFYNLEGGPRRLVVKHGSVKAVAPGLRLVEATPEEKLQVAKKSKSKSEPVEYGLPV